MDTPTNTATNNPAVDDFAEFLTTSYATYLHACHERGWNTEFVFSLSGYALRICDVYAGPVEITDGNRPLPAAPTDAERWLFSSGVGTASLPTGADVDAWTNTVEGLLHAGR